MGGVSINLTHGEYEFVRYTDREGALVLRYVGGMKIERPIQAWLLSETTKSNQCCICMKRTRKGDSVWRPITTARNQKHRICQVCMVLVEHNM